MEEGSYREPKNMASDRGKWKKGAVNQTDLIKKQKKPWYALDIFHNLLNKLLVYWNSLWRIFMDLCS